MFVPKLIETYVFCVAQREVCISLTLNICTVPMSVLILKTAQFDDLHTKSIFNTNWRETRYIFVVGSLRLFLMKPLPYSSHSYLFRFGGTLITFYFYSNFWIILSITPELLGQVLFCCWIRTRPRELFGRRHMDKSWGQLPHWAHPAHQQWIGTFCWLLPIVGIQLYETPVEYIHWTLWVTCHVPILLYIHCPFCLWVLFPEWWTTKHEFCTINYSLFIIM